MNFVFIAANGVVEPLPENIELHREQIQNFVDGVEKFPGQAYAMWVGFAGYKSVDGSETLMIRIVQLTPIDAMNIEIEAQS